VSEQKGYTTEETAKELISEGFPKVTDDNMANIIFEFSESTIKCRIDENQVSD